MRALFLLASLALAGAAAPAPRKPAAMRPAPAAPVAEPAGPTEAELLTQARQQMDLARAEIQRLRIVADEAEGQKATIADLRAKNARLIEAGEALIAAYEKRWGKSVRVDAFGRARVKFETEMQDRRDALYRNGADAPAAAAEPATAEPAPQSPPQGR